jgi:type II secretory pathway component PulJ
LEFLCFATQAWAADNYERRITRELDAAEQREKAANIAREKARVDHERSLADADAAELEKDVLTTNSMLEYQRRHGDIAAVPRDKAINPPLENLSTLTVVDFSLREGRDTDEAEPTTASRQKRRKKISAFTVDLSLTRQAAMVRGHKLGVNGATALAAELSTGACPKMSVLDLSRCELKSKGLGRLLRVICDRLIIKH